MISVLTRQVKEIFSSDSNFLVPFEIVTVNLVDLQEKLDSSENLGAGDFFLSEKEQEKLRQYRYQKRKIEWLGGRIAAKYAAARLAENKDNNAVDWKSLCWAELEIVARPDGKPFFFFLD